MFPSQYWIWIGLAALALWLLLRPRPSRQSPPAPSEPDSLAPEGDRLEGEPCPLPIEDNLDLHAFSPRDIVSVADEYLRQACQAGFSEVRLIHGRGTGFQRDRIRQLLSTHPLVARFGDAPPERGGWGATLVTLACGEATEARSKRLGKRESGQPNDG